MGRWAKKIGKCTYEEHSKHSKVPFECFECSLPGPIEEKNETHGQLLNVIEDISSDLPISAEDIYSHLSYEDINDWDAGNITVHNLRALADSVLQRKMIDQGEVPSHYTKIALCDCCGPIWFWFSGKIQGCPWCWNRKNDRPIPRAEKVHCKDCKHFNRQDHPNLGNCGKGEIEDTSGLWDEDKRSCSKWLPLPEGNIKHGE